MPYALVQDVPASWPQYEQFAAALLDPTPAGLIMHLAGPTDEGVRVIEVWSSEQDWQRYQAERLTPAIAALGGPARPAAAVRDLHAHHALGSALEPSTSTKGREP